MPAKQSRRRQVEQPGFILIDQASALLGGGPFLAHDVQRRADVFGLAHDDRQRSFALTPDHSGHAAPQNGGFLGRDFLQRVAKQVDMIDRHRRDHARDRLFDHVRRIEPPAKTDLQ
jgi:hypothetical protein